MTEFVDIPDGWSEVGYDVGPSRGDGPYLEEFEGTWASNDEQIIIHSHHTVETTGEVLYPIIVEQHIVCDGLKTEVQTDAQVADNRQQAEEYVVQYMEDVDAGQHRHRPIGVDVPGDDGFVQFYTLCDTELPGQITADQLIDSLETSNNDDDIDGLPDDISRDLADEELIQIDVFPRLRDDVTEVDDT